ncbi:MAG: Na+:solute symporter [Candidatus Aminicenantes bacterium]|nr:Na+:solute symporter [Candidatus Aminicenantes bacterium]MDH5714369.1 Na+:solute symporter [Candidatus Aminicenantes bacterium]
MLLSFNDLLFIIAFFLISIVIGVLVTKRAGSSSVEYFVAGKNLPWWILGISMVATTFSTDTPNLVTDIVRREGASGNWIWFAFLITGMFTVFIYAKLWKRSNVLTDIEFYELRYSGKAATFLRGFRALYLGIIFNVIVMATVTLAAIKIGGVLLGISPVTTVLIAGIIVVIYSTLGGLRGVLLTDFFQFFMAMLGSVMAAVVVVNLPQVGGLGNLRVHELVQGNLSLWPDFSDINTLWAIFIIPLAVQWWSVWYPGAEPGGGGYIAQRMFAAKDEKNSIGATLLFNIAHYALRPWPWIIVALSSMVVFPDLASLRQAFPNVDPGVINHDMAYPAMLSFLPHGLLGIVVASLVAAYMSTISTHLNWGSSYIVNDFYKRFVKPDATEKELVRMGRISTVLLMTISCLLALLLSNALQAFHILLQIGAGTGLLFLLRWFWWRINAISEIFAMTTAFLVAVYFEFIHVRIGFFLLDEWQRLVIGVAITTSTWLTVTFLTRPTKQETLLQFYRLIKPGGPGWKKFLTKAEKEGQDISGLSGDKWDVPTSLISVFLGCLSVYSALFAAGFWIYANYTFAVIATTAAVLSTIGLIKSWGKLRTASS